MKLVRTPLRLKSGLKKAIQKHALNENISLQHTLSATLEKFLKGKGRNKAKKLIFRTHDLRVPLDNLTRNDYYNSPLVRG